MNNFIKLNNQTYIFYLEDFLNAESFSLALLEFLGNYGKLNKSTYKDCDIYIVWYSPMIYLQFKWSFYFRM